MVLHLAALGALLGGCKKLFSALATCVRCVEDAREGAAHRNQRRNSAGRRNPNEDFVTTEQAELRRTLNRLCVEYELETDMMLDAISSIGRFEDLPPSFRFSIRRQSVCNVSAGPVSSRFEEPPRMNRQVTRVRRASSA